MKHLYAILLVLAITGQAMAQAPGDIYGLEFTLGTLKFAKGNPTTGNVSVLSPGPTSPDHFNSGVSDMDPQNNRYFYIRYNQIITVDITNGQVLHNPTISSAVTGFSHQPFVTNIAYNWTDNTIYCLLHYNQQLWFAKIDPVTGVFVPLSNGPITSDLYQSGVSDIDCINGRYFYIRNGQIITVDIATATVLHSPSIQNPNGAVSPITNIAYNWLTDEIYGLNFVGGSWNGGSITNGEMRLATVNPVNGQVNIISPFPTSPDQFSSGVSDIDPYTNAYYYVRANRIYTVDLSTGTLINNKALQNANNAIAPLTNIEVYKNTEGVPPTVASFKEEHHNALILFKNTSTYAYHSDWDFGDGSSSTDRNPSHEYAQPGPYTVTLRTENRNGEINTVSKTVWVGSPVSINDDWHQIEMSIFPQPAVDRITVTNNLFENRRMDIFTTTGQLVQSEWIQPGTQQISVENLTPGVYLYNMGNAGGQLLIAR